MGQTHALQQYAYANNLTPPVGIFLLYFPLFVLLQCSCSSFYQKANIVANSSVHIATQHGTQPTMLANNNDAVFQGS